MGESLLFLALPIVAILAFGLLVLAARLLSIWYGAFRNNARVPMWRILELAAARLNPRPIVEAYVLAVAGDVETSFEDVVMHARSGGRVQRTVLAAVAAKRAGVELPFSMARAMDLTGRDPVEVAQDLIRAKKEGDRDAAGAITEADARALIGKAGAVTVAVAPPGLVEIEGRRINAVCLAGYMKKGAAVRAVAAVGNMVIVEPEDKAL